jgi:hypothetical protein
MTQAELEFRAVGGGRTQNEKLAAYLRANVGRWIPMPELAKVITPTGIGAAVHSRVADCRKPPFGMEIQHRRGRNRLTGLTTSEYLYDGSHNETPTADPG